MAKKKYPSPQNKNYSITYKDTPFTVDEYGCSYEDEEPDRLLVHITILAPKSAEPDFLTISLPFDEIIRITEHFEEPEIKYIKSVVNAFKDKPQYEKLAFESLLYDESFDMYAFLTRLVSKMKLSYNEDSF